MGAPEFALYAMLVSGGVFVGNRFEHYQMTKQIENERQTTQRNFSDIHNRLSVCETELKKYETTNIDTTWKLNPDLSVDITGIDGTRTVEWRPEYQEIFRKQRR